MNKKEKVTELFFNGCNCAQSVICAYAFDYGLDEEMAFRLSEGFGSGIVGFEGLCGACSAMVMVASLRSCLKKDVENPTRLQTYEKVSECVLEFEKRMGALDCATLKETRDATMIQGKRKGCLECVQCVCDILEGN